MTAAKEWAVRERLVRVVAVCDPDRGFAPDSSAVDSLREAGRGVMLSRREEAERDAMVPPPLPPDRREPSEPSEVAPVIEIEDVIDLHGFQPRDIPSVVEEYLHAAREKGYREVRLIHGRGTGFQRQRVREVLAGLACVERFADAPPGRGGWGATLVWLGAKA